MKYLIPLILLLTSCVTHKTDSGWVTEPLFWDTSQQRTESIRLTVRVAPQAEIDRICARFGTSRACAINGTAYIQGIPQSVTMMISPEYIDALPSDEGKAGDMLAEKLGLELAFNRRADLGHEAIQHIFNDRRHLYSGTPHI